MCVREWKLYENEKKLLLKEKASQSGIQLVEWLEDGSLALGLGDGIIRTFYIDKEEGEAKQQTEWKLGIFCRGVRTLGLIPEEIRRLLEEHAAGSE